MEKIDLDLFQRLLNALLEIDPAEIGRQDTGLLNLLCAPALPGSENLDVPRCLARLDHLTDFVKRSTERNLYRFPSDPDYGHCEPMWRMAMLVTNMKLDFGVTYDPFVMDDLLKTGDSHFTDSRNVFIHGMLADDPRKRWGSCSSIPVLITAVARRLGYPVHIAVNTKHVYARWDDGNGFAFNIEASGAGGMAILPDEHYRIFHGALTEEDERTGFYLRSLAPDEEFASFMMNRVWCLHDAARYSETLLWSARALQFMPDSHPRFSRHAYATADLAIKHRYRRKYPERPIPPIERNDEFFFFMGEFLAIPERSLFLTIVAHYLETLGKLDKARQYYEEACRQNFHGNNEQRDLQRFLRKHGMKRRPGPLLPSGDIGRPRRIKLPNCPPELEYDVLRRLADRFERQDELVKARDTLHDLYLLDPCDAEIFQRARALERQPRFQTQLKAVIEERRHMLLRSGRLN